jgi:hemolysin activation/secretion protein
MARGKTLRNVSCIIALKSVLRFAWLLALTAVASAYAQEPAVRLPSAAEPDVRMERVAPAAPVQSPSEVRVPESALSRAPAGSERVRFILNGVDVEGATIYPPDVVKRLYADKIGSEVSLADVYGIAEEIQRMLRKGGCILARAILPPQAVTDGRPHIRVFEGFISDVQIEGDVGAVAELVKAQLQNVVYERPLRMKTLERYLLLADDIPGVKVSGVLRPSPDQAGAGELVVAIERRPVEATVTSDNFGGSLTGKWEFAASAGLSAFTSLGENIFLSGLVSDPWRVFSGDDENQKVIQFGGSLRPGARGVYINLLGSYGNSKPGGEISQFDFNSDELLLSAVVGYPVVRSRRANLAVELGFDYIDSSTDIFDDVKFSRDRLRVLHLSGVFDFRDSWQGSNFGRVSIRQGLPIFNASESGDDCLSRADGDGVFTTVRAEAWRMQHISGGLALLGRIAGQYAFQDLLSDEEFDVGGSRFGRGYDPSELSGDHGAGFSGELQYTRAVELAYLDKWQVFGFYDFGDVWDRGQDASDSLASAGGGLRGWLPRDVSVELTVAKPLTMDSLRADGGKDPQVLLRAYTRF